MGPSLLLPEEPRALAAEVVRRWGPHPAGRWGISLEPDAPRETSRWLLAVCLWDGKSSEEAASGAFQALGETGWDHPAGLATADPAALETRLADAGLSRPDMRAALLLRVARALGDDPDRWLEATPRESASLEELGGRLARLAPGFGRAAITRFLQPLREVWPAAAELPLDPAAHAAAVHLGLLEPGQDEEGEPSVLRRLLRDADVALGDVEAGLARLGRQACLRNKTARCPLAEACPAREASP